MSDAKVKPPDYRWAEEDNLFEDSLKYKKLWIDSFFVYALVWAFGSLLTLESKNEFDKYIKSVFATRD